MLNLHIFEKAISKLHTYVDGRGGGWHIQILRKEQFQIWICTIRKPHCMRLNNIIWTPRSRDQILTHDPTLGPREQVMTHYVLTH